MKFKIGQKASIEKSFSINEVRDFAGITGDHNPIHLDEEFAKRTVFGKPIVHGILCSGLISCVIGEQLPGNGSIYLGQELKFVAPAFHGERLIAEVEILEVIIEKRHIILKTVIRKSDGTIVIEGKARVKVQTL